MERAGSNPPCPKCGAGSNKLKFDGFAQIYECANFDGCGDTFRVPVVQASGNGATPPLRVLPPDSPTRSISRPSEAPPTTHFRPTSDVLSGSPVTTKPDVKEKKRMSQSLTCEFCPETFDSPWKRGAHRRNAHPGQKPKVVIDTPRREAPARAPKSWTKPAPVTQFKDVIDRLRAKRQQLIDGFVEGSAEIAAVDRAIQALEG